MGGVAATTWKKRFQFEPADGLFEFREDQMVLERGFLQLTFRGYSFQSRAIRFPQHYSLEDTDCDLCWEYPGEEEAVTLLTQWEEAPLSLPPKSRGVAPLSSVDTESTASTPRRRQPSVTQA